MTNTKPMSPAEVIAGLLKDHAGAELRLRAWDGSEAVRRCHRQPPSSGSAAACTAGPATRR